MQSFSEQEESFESLSPGISNIVDWLRFDK